MNDTNQQYSTSTLTHLDISQYPCDAYPGYQNIQKRDGSIVPFDMEKIVTAIFKAAQAVGGKDLETARQLAQKVVAYLIYHQGVALPCVEEVQDAVEKILIENGHARTAKAYILYRDRRTRIREGKSELMDAVAEILIETNRENANIGNFPYLVGYVPITSSSGTIVGVLSVPVIYKDSLTERDLAQSLAFIFGGYILVFFLIVVLGYYLSKVISTPVRNLTDATRKIIFGDLETRIPVTGNDEISELITSFNKMTSELKENQKELAKAEREAAWKEMARQVAHEIKNPLTPMKLSVQHLQRMAKDKAPNFNEIFERVTKTLLEQIDTMTKIVSGFSHFAKMPERNIDKCDIHDIIIQAINLFKDEKAIDFEVKFCDNTKIIEGDKEELRRVFINLFRNSIQAINSKNIKHGKIIVSTIFEGKQFLIKINDNGTGIPDEIIPRLFDVNFSTKKDGMGIGLKISKKTIHDMGGDIRIQSVENEGTTVEITL